MLRAYTLPWARLVRHARRAALQAGTAFGSGAGDGAAGTSCLLGLRCETGAVVLILQAGSVPSAVGGRHAACTGHTPGPRSFQLTLQYCCCILRCNHLPAGLMPCSAYSIELPHDILPPDGMGRKHWQSNLRCLQSKWGLLAAHLMPAMLRSGVAGALAGATAWRLMGSADLLLGRAGDELGVNSSAHHPPAYRDLGWRGGKACTWPRQVLWRRSPSPPLPCRHSTS